MLGAAPGQSVAAPIGTDTTPPAVNSEFPQTLLDLTKPHGDPPPPQQPQPQKPVPPLPHPKHPDPQLAKCTIKGTRGNDRLKGTSKRDVICGLGGKDRISARGGNDLIIGGPGRDKVNAGAGRDVIQAKDGSRDRVNGGRGRDRASTDRVDKTRSVEVVKRQAARRSLRSSGDLVRRALAGCYDKRARGLSSSQFDILSGGIEVSAHGGAGYGSEWAKVQDFLFVWNGARWVYQTTDTPAYAQVTLGGRISDWMLSNGASTQLNPAWNVFGGYWLGPQMITWYDSSGHQIDQYYYAISHTSWSDGAGGGDNWLTDNKWCGVG
jgi:Ca2+-binding RTX toxin-like protein